MATSAVRPGPWLAALEGYYGPPLAHEQRVELIEWLGGAGYDAFAYAPKDDAFQRARWREPYPADDLAHFAELQAVCADSGVQLNLSVSPGLDWQAGDPRDVDLLTVKLAAFRELGITALSVNWDDVPGGGAELGAEHASAVAAVVDRLGPGVRWMSCPVDYAMTEPTEYLRGFAGALPADVEVLWTGASVLAPTLAADEVRTLTDALGHRLVFADNFPVNDLGMAQVLHLGPYPHRDPATAGLLGGVVLNMMEHPRASRLGLAVAARFWRDPHVDRRVAWRETLEGEPGLAPLAQACSAWVDDPGPDAELLAWADAAGPDDRRLRAHLEAGCRSSDLDPALGAEVEPWLAQWELEATAMLAALRILEGRGEVPVPAAWAAAATWRVARAGGPQVFGTRFAMYPATRRAGDRLVAAAGAVIDGTNLTDRLWRRALQHLAG